MSCTEACLLRAYVLTERWLQGEVDDLGPERWLRGEKALLEDPDLTLRPTWNSSLRVPNILFQLSWAVHTCGAQAYMQTEHLYVTGDVCL